MEAQILNVNDNVGLLKSSTKIDTQHVAECELVLFALRKQIGL